ncbi:phosphotransferase [Holospora curviuscula]|uniref:Choline/ethanolamine kinase n=1 Tax=Holospora curviuscula TaxID=1082868 RepID=A0A2S5R6U5_9PROT|nr:phosphotransferase [Holospora curviuscula]PPE03007.1 Choline/ethanolamine kinase [Holospora curviuscula]
MEPDLLEAVTKALEDCFGGEVTISDVKFLSEPNRRNRIARLFLSTNNCDTRSVIFKQSISNKSQETTDEDILARFARDFAGLKFLNGSDINHSIPKFLGVSQSFRFILLEDLGNTPISLVDSLTKSDPGKALEALKRFTKSLAHFHMASYERLGEYDELLASAHPNKETLEDRIKWNEEDLIPKLELVCNNFDIAFTNELKQEVIYVIKMSLSPDDFYVLTHSDICPDNIFDHEDKDELQLIDFEWARPGNNLLDATYFRMNFPTCWCAKALPEEMILELEGFYRQTIASKIRASLDDRKYNENYVSACGFWLLSSMPFALRIMDKDECWSSGPVPTDSLWKPEADLARPRVISRLQAFIKVSKEHNMLPHLRQSAEQMLAHAYEKWHDARPLGLYPAFQS